jgi:hypothetical protein
MKLQILLPLLALLFTLPTNVSADHPAHPSDYTITTVNRRYIFVMLASYNGCYCPDVGEVYKDEEIRRTYAQSGLYRNDGSTTPLWTVDWYAYGAAVSSDGQHLVRYGYRAGNTGGLAFAFYEEGRQIAVYRKDQLLLFPPPLPYSALNVNWVEETSFDDQQGLFTIKTLEGAQYVFDMATGQAISGTVLPVNGYLLVGGIVALISLPLLYLSARRRNPWRKRLINKWAAPRPLL